MPRVEILSNKSSRKQKALGRRAAEKEGVVTEHQTDIEPDFLELVSCLQFLDYCSDFW